jgi:hypothetical protein
MSDENASGALKAHTTVNKIKLSLKTVKYGEK